MTKNWKRGAPDILDTLFRLRSRPPLQISFQVCYFLWRIIGLCNQLQADHLGLRVAEIADPYGAPHELSN
jgi:hypothetical protein